MHLSWKIPAILLFLFALFVVISWIAGKTSTTARILWLLRFTPRLLAWAALTAAAILGLDYRVTFGVAGLLVLEAGQTYWEALQERRRERKSDEIFGRKPQQSLGDDMKAPRDILVFGTMHVIALFGALVGGEKLGLDSSTIGFIMGVIAISPTVSILVWNIAYVRGRRDAWEELKRTGEI